MLHTLNFIDLFAGAGGLSEGFVRADFIPVAHIEMNNDACNTFETLPEIFAELINAITNLPLRACTNSRKQM
jgi:site-specific DNA-cytosine methylase